MAGIIKGAEVAGAIRERIMETISTHGLVPCLVLLRVGNNPGDLAYERGIRKTCEAAGIEVRVFEFAADVGQEELLAGLATANEDPEIHGILIFKPLPAHIDTFAIDRAICPEKDMDCISPANWARLAMAPGEGFAPCTAEAVVKLLDHVGCEISGANAVIIGRSNVIGKPLGLLLLARSATVTWCHSRTRDIADRCKGADILISACGVAGLVGENIAKGVSPGCVAIDVGMNFADGKMCGDMKFDEVAPYVKMITPVPGGVGAVTNTVLALHVTLAALKRHKA
ncbi:MAG: bifunctional 5,10-methylenetetrahydrofolate dehydrogenase/5,10-methenyltetrahydrofolate cyclohydrolase [Lachnospiraceae bacterium]|jgi:methylenetetrahydrofolate dehydrogenase (NADP+)/methenyltetrahydrofolate cyclohydrolase